MEFLEVKGEIRTLQIKEPNRTDYWNVNIVECRPELYLPIWEGFKEVKGWVKKWCKVFPREKTLAWEFGVGGMIVRVDCTFCSGNVVPYEIEDSPAGIGIATQVVPGFKEKLEKLSWNKVIVLVPPRRKGGDDYLWTETREIKDENELSQIPEDYWIASRLGSLPLPFQRRSIWPVKFRETKRYLVDLGLAEEWDRKTSLEQVVNFYANKKGTEGVVFKGDGARAEKVKIILFKGMNRKIKKWLRNTGGMGVWKLGSIKEEVEKWEPLYIQPWYSPIKVLFNHIPMYGILRIYLGFSVKDREWNLLGGFINARPSLLIHGATDALFIPVSVP
jgi:hypothetical protein